jgi:aryl-alcohol dehydrogenase-like predicted oxidoreductase
MICAKSGEVIGSSSTIFPSVGLSETGPDTIRRTHAVHSISALQSEYSVWTPKAPKPTWPLLRELGIGFVAYSPLGHGFLTGKIRSIDDLADSDWRKTNPRLPARTSSAICAIADDVESIATEVSATPARGAHMSVTKPIRNREAPVTEPQLE